MQKVFIKGEWRESVNPVGSFQAPDPSTGMLLPDIYPVSGWDEIEEAIEAGAAAAVEMRRAGPDAIAEFLEAFADEIEAAAGQLVEMAHAETGLPKTPRLGPTELPRTTGQLRQAANAARERSWCMATIDTKNNIRSMFAPLNAPVVVFGPNNFPFAFNGVAGGDFAAAIAAGNPVIAKANPGHPGTTRLLAEAAHRALQRSSLPPAAVQMIYRLRSEDGLKLVSHPKVGATGFTGSRSAGMALKAAADAAGKPIYLEMSSINPLLVLPGALDERLEEIAAELSGSCVMGAGQFCTRPGLVITIDGEKSRRFASLVAENMQAAPVGALLGKSSPQMIDEVIHRLQAGSASVLTGGAILPDPGFRYANTVLTVSGDDFLRCPDEMQTEAFGPVTMVVFARDAAQMVEIISTLEGNLTGSIYSSRAGADDALYALVEPGLRARVGRLLNDKMPTGVTVTPAMVHGGPYPSTGHPGFTSVGIPAAIHRFAALHCYDNVRPERLPAELADRNPTGKMWRLIDGQWSQADI